MRLFFLLAMFVAGLSGSVDVLYAKSQSEVKSQTRKTQENSHKKGAKHILLIEGAKIIKRDCFQRYFEVEINKKYFVVFFNNLDGDLLGEKDNAMMLCNRHLKGFRRGNIVNIKGTVLEHNGIKALYNAEIYRSSRP